MTRRKPYSEITAELKDIIKFLDTLNEKIMEARRNRGISELAKRVAGMIKVQHSLPHAPRLSDEDRKIPLESVRREEFRMENGAELDSPLIHYGSYANELTRSRNLIALAIGSDIYIRGGHYKPETEEGRALLAHELTHVAQYTEKRISAKEKDSRETMEREAEQNEAKEVYDPDPVIIKTIAGVEFRIRQSQTKMVKAMIKDRLEERIEEYCDKAGEKQSSSILKVYRDMKDSGELDAWLNGQ